MGLGIPHTNPILQQLYYNVNVSMLPKGIVLYVCVCVCTNGSKEVSFGWDQIYNYLGLLARLDGLRLRTNCHKTQKCAPRPQRRSRL